MNNLLKLKEFIDHAADEVKALRRIGTEEELERELETVKGLRIRAYKEFREARIEEEEGETVLELKRLEDKLERNLKEIENQLKEEIELLGKIKRENRRKKNKEYIIKKELEELGEYENQLETILVYRQSGEFIQYHPEKKLAIVGDRRATAYYLHTGAGIEIRIRELKELEELEENLERKGVKIYKV